MPNRPPIMLDAKQMTACRNAFGLSALFSRRMSISTPRPMTNTPRMALRIHGALTLSSSVPGIVPSMPQTTIGATVRKRMERRFFHTITAFSRSDTGSSAGVMSLLSSRIASRGLDSSGSPKLTSPLTI